MFVLLISGSMLTSILWITCIANELTSDLCKFKKDNIIYNLKGFSFFGLHQDVYFLFQYHLKYKNILPQTDYSNTHQPFFCQYTIKLSLVSSLSFEHWQNLPVFSLFSDWLKSDGTKSQQKYAGKCFWIEPLLNVAGTKMMQSNEVLAGVKNGTKNNNSKTFATQH